MLGSLLKIVMSKNLKDFQKVPNVPKESKMIQKEFQIIPNNIGGCPLCPKLLKRRPGLQNALYLCMSEAQSVGCGDVFSSDFKQVCLRRGESSKGLRVLLSASQCQCVS